MSKHLTIWLLSAMAAFGAISVSPTSYSVSYKQGSAVPAPLPVAVQSSGTLFTVSVDGTSSAWLDTNPKQGVGSTTVNVIVDPRNLAIGTYSGTVTFSEPLPTPTSVTFQVSLVVTSSTATPTPIGSASAGYVAHIADGASWTTALTVVNLMDTPQRLTVKFWSDSGSALTLPVAGVGSYSGVYFDLGANGSGELQTAGTSPSLATGWVSIEGSGTGFGAVAIFRSSADGRADAEATSPLVFNPFVKSVIPFDNRSGFATGVALANFDTKSNIASFTFRDGNGKPILSATLPLSSGQHTSFAVADKYPSLAGTVGTLEIDSSGVVALGLRFNPKGSFTSIQMMERAQ